MAKKIEDEMPQPLTREGAQKDLWKTNKEELMASLSTYLLQEMERFNALLDKMVGTLDDLRKAIRGEMVMSEDLDAMYNSMLNNKVPENWAVIAYPSLKPLTSWIANLKERIAFFRLWLETGHPRAYWMPSFFFPQGFLTSLLQ